MVGVGGVRWCLAAFDGEFLSFYKGFPYEGFTKALPLTPFIAATTAAIVVPPIKVL